MDNPTEKLLEDKRNVARKCLFIFFLASLCDLSFLWFKAEYWSHEVCRGPGKVVTFPGLMAFMGAKVMGIYYRLLPGRIVTEDQRDFLVSAVFSNTKVP
jgi:hypothetical protein